MRAPIRFARGNLLFGHTDRDVWALYRLAMEPYDGLSSAEKRELMTELATFAYSVKADFTLHRVSRSWSVDEHVERCRAMLDHRHGHRDRWEAVLAAHRELLEADQIVRPEVYLAIRLAPPQGATVGELASRVAGALRSLGGARRATGLRDPRALGESRLRELAVRERQVLANLEGLVAGVERATSLDLQWLLRRSFTRGVGEPDLDVFYEPQALVLLEGDELQYVPTEHDVLRLFESPIEVADRGLRIRGERGESHQAFLVVGALPERVTFPGPDAELLFAPLEELGFPIDATVSAEWVPNDQARALVRRRIVDADNILHEESHGDHGPTLEADERPDAARALDQYLAGQSRPPLLRATLVLAVGAASAEELEHRVAEVRAAYRGVTLHRPFGEQLYLFKEHFPAQGTQVRDYADYLLVEQLAAMVPTATHAVGSDRGPYIGHTLSGSQQPVLFDLTEASRVARTPTTLLIGASGAGKTMLLQLLLYMAFCTGSRVVDVDPKGDHHLERLPGVAEELQQIEIIASERYRGLLDPLRIAGPGLEFTLATTWLIDILGPGHPAEYRTLVKRAVKDVLDHEAIPHCGHVLDRLRHGGRDARSVADALEVDATAGLAQLGFADDEHLPVLAGEKAITSLKMRGLSLPEPGRGRDQLLEEERVGQALVRLLAALAMNVIGGDRGQHKVFAFEEAWFLLDDSAGRRLIERLNRWGRSENATPLLVTHLVSDASEIDNLIGPRFVFGFESEDEAASALALLGLDGGDPELVGRLIAFGTARRRGKCMLRDLEGRVASVQIDPPPALLEALRTEPQVEAAQP